MIEELIPPEPTQEMPKSKWKMWLAAGGCFVLICGMVFVGTLIFAGPKFIRQFLPEKIQAADGLPREITESNTMGNPNAPVHIIEYGDFQCPYCLKFWAEAEPQLIDRYVNTGKVFFEYRAVAFIGPESADAAKGAYCAGDQNKFWEFHDTLFSNWTGENAGDFTQDKLIKYANTLALNMDEFKSCLSEDKHKVTVDQDAAKAEADGVHATPTLFINGVKVEGAQPFSALKQLIEQALNGNLDKQSG